MYSRNFTARTIEATNAKQGWDLVSHSHADIASAIAHFEDVWDADGNRLKRPLAPDEARFIQNERKLCGLDFLYWAENFAEIVNWKKQPQLFKANIAQDIEIDIWAEFEEQARAIHVQNLKARRL